MISWTREILVVGCVALLFAACNYQPDVLSSGLFVCQTAIDCAGGFECLPAQNGRNYCCSSQHTDVRGVCPIAAGDGGWTYPPGDSNFDPRQQPALVWGEMTLPLNTRTVRSIWGRSSSEVYAGTSTGKLLRYDGVAWQQIASSFNNSQISGIWGTSDRLYLATSYTGGLWVYDGNIFESYPVGPVQTFNDIWGFDNEHVYLVAAETNGTALYEWDGSTIQRIYAPTGVGALLSVWGPSPDLLYIGATGGKIFRRDMGVTTEEVIEFPPLWDINDIAYMDFHGVRGIGDELYAVGYRHMIFRRMGDGVWRLVYDPSLSGELRALAGWQGGSGVEAYAVGWPAIGGPIARWDSATWEPAGVTKDYNLWDIWSPEPKTYFAAGSVSGGIDGYVIIGRRPAP